MLLYYRWMLVFVCTEIVWTFLIWNLERLINLVSREFNISRCPLFLCTASQCFRRASVRYTIHRRCLVGRSSNIFYLYILDQDVILVLQIYCSVDIKVLFMRFVACDIYIYEIAICVFFLSYAQLNKYCKDVVCIVFLWSKYNRNTYTMAIRCPVTHRCINTRHRHSTTQTRSMIYLEFLKRISIPNQVVNLNIYAKHVNHL